MIEIRITFKSNEPRKFEKYSNKLLQKKNSVKLKLAEIKRMYQEQNGKKDASNMQAYSSSN